MKTENSTRPMYEEKFIVVITTKIDKVEKTYNFKEIVFGQVQMDNRSSDPVKFTLPVAIRYRDSCISILNSKFDCNDNVSVNVEIFEINNK